MFAVPSFFGYNTTFVSTPVATAATGVGETSFTANWNAFTGATYYLLDVSTSPSFSSFVLQDEVVIAPTTSYVVIGLTASTTYYYRLRASTDPYIDPDASAFFARVTAAGGTLSATEQTATNQLVLDMKAAGVWTKMKAVYPMVGGGTGTTAARQAACEQNLVSSSFTGTFTSGWTFASTGVTGNGTSSYMDTGFVISDNLIYDNQSYSIYKTTVSSGLACEFGVSYSNAINGVGMFLDAGYSYINTFVINSPFSSSTTSGNYILNRIDQFTKKLFRNGSLFDTKTDGATNYNYLGYTVYLGGRNDYGTLLYPTNTETRFFTIGDGLTDTQASNFYTAVQAFQTTLSRQV